MGWCRLFSREMRGLVADASSFNGGGGGPSLGLDFMVPGVLDPRITFTRASTGTYFNSDGVMQTAAINAPRWDYDPSTLALRGLLLEDARTNLALQSGNAAVWQTASGTVVVPAMTANQIAAPDGTVTAARAVYPAVSGASVFSFLFLQFTATAAPYTLSVWLRGSVGGEQTYIYITNGTTTNVRLRCTLTTAWQRFTVTSGNLTAATWYGEVGTDLRDGGQTATPAQTIYIWGAQLEAGAFSTSYVPTTSAAVTRASDSCAISAANMAGWFVSPGGSWMAEFIYFNPAPVNARIIDQQGAPTGGGITPIFVASSQFAAQYDGNAAVTSGNVLANNTVSKAATTWTPSTGKVCANGGGVASGAMTSGYSSLVPTGVFLLIGANAGNTDNAPGYIRAVRYWSRVLTDAEMQTVTTP
jgi:hypothetical protein